MTGQALGDGVAVAVTVIGPLAAVLLAAVLAGVGYLLRSELRAIQRRLDRLDARLTELEQDDRQRLTRVESILDLIALPAWLEHHASPHRGVPLVED